MIRTKLMLIAFVASCFLAAPLAFSQGGSASKSTKADQSSKAVEQQITALANQFIQAFEKADTGFMEKYFADDFTAIHSNGQLYSKAQEIDNVKSGNLKWETVDTRERKVHAHGDAAVVVGLASSTGTLGGKPYSGDYRTTQFWVKKNGNWKVVAFQSTRLPAGTQ